MVPAITAVAVGTDLSYFRFLTSSQFDSCHLYPPKRLKYPCFSNSIVLFCNEISNSGLIPNPITTAITPPGDRRVFKCLSARIVLVGSLGDSYQPTSGSVKTLIIKSYFFDDL